MTNPTPAPAEALSRPPSPVADALGGLMSEFGAGSGTALRKPLPASWGVAVLWDEEDGEVTQNGMVAVSVHRRLLDAALARAEAAEAERDRLRALVDAEALEKVLDQAETLYMETGDNAIGKLSDALVRLSRSTQAHADQQARLRALVVLLGQEIECAFKDAEHAARNLEPKPMKVLEGMWWTRRAYDAVKACADELEAVLNNP